MNIKHFLYTCVVAVCFILVACSDNKEDATATPENNKIEINFKDVKTNSPMTLDFAQSSNGVELISNPPRPKHIAIIAILPKDCDTCMQVLPHIGNLSSRLNNVDIMILRDDSKSYTQGDFLMPKNTRFLEFVAVGNAITFIMDSIKRALNMQIKDYNNPLFLLIDKDGIILRSYEGAVLEEILEIGIEEIKKRG